MGWGGVGGLNKKNSACFLSCLLAASNKELLEGSDVINEEIHEPQLFAEPNQDEQTSGMQCNAIRFLLELFVNVKVAENNAISA